MAIRSIAQLKAWFRRGKYPTEEQFADWIDSFVHKEEGTIPVDKVENLPALLNNKYDRQSGEELERDLNNLSKDYEQHKKDNEADIKQINEELDALAEEDERQQGEIDALNSDVDSIRKKDTEQDAEIAALHKTDTDLQNSLNDARLDIGKIRELIKTGSTLDDARTAMLALGENYLSLYALASTVKTFIETTDTKDVTINTWKEVENFLQGITDVETLTGLLQQLEQRITLAYESAIASAVKVETDRALSAEAALQKGIDAEKNRAENAEAAIGKRIDDTKAGLQQTDAEIRQDIAAVRQTIFAMQSESAGRVIPLVMNVDVPHRITYGNKVKQYIKAELLPQFAVQNVLWLADGKAVDVEPDGEVVVQGIGKSRVHVIPTENTALHQTVTVEVVKPAPIKSNGAFLLVGKHFLFT